jgi:hypothetical protein
VTIGFARFVPSLVGLAGFGLCAVLWLLGAHATYDQLLTLWGIVPFRVPFLDIDGPLSSMECARQGLDVIAANPCDIEQRPFNYSPVLLSFAWLPLGSADRVWLGFIVDLLFFCSLATLPPPFSWRETLARVAASVSTMVVFAVERCNTDVAVFVLVVLMLHLLNRSRFVRICGYGVGFAGGAIKYYPFILLALVAKERLRFAALLAATLIGACVAFYLGYAEQLARTLKLVPFNTAFTDMFGAINLLDGMFELLRPFAQTVEGAVEAALGVLLPLLIVALWAFIRLWRASRVSLALTRLDEPRSLALLAGALVICVCFLTSQSVGYRGIFLLLLLPGLAAIGRDSAVGPVASAARAAAIGIPVLMWSESIRLIVHLAATGRYPAPAFARLHALADPADLLAWGAREIAWWLLVVLLLMLLAVFFFDRASSFLRELGGGARPRA